MDYDIGRNNLEELFSWYKLNAARRNEATTRLTMIDRLFFECLSWSKDDVVLEESHDNTYADYLFSAPRRILIVEAKKEGDYFEVPIGENRIEYSLNNLTRDNNSLKKAVEQTLNYCQNRGVPYGVVCNGHQIVAFIATRNDGIAPIQGKAMVFSSFEVMLSKFLDLWNILSKPGIEKKEIQRRLIGDSLPELPPKLSASIPHYPGLKDRNPFQTDLQILSELVIEDIARSRDIETHFLKECYCPSGALSQYALISKNILNSRYAAIFESGKSHPVVISATTKDGILKDLSQSFGRRPVLLIGDVGVGKTAFIRNLIKVEAVELFDNAITLYLDFGSQATLTEDLKQFIVDEITEQLRLESKIDIEEKSFVRAVYNTELERFKRGIYQDLAKTDPAAFKLKELVLLEEKIGNKENHLKQSLFHISKFHEKQIVLFLDNADQRDDKLQQDIFLIAQELAERWPLTVFLTLRPETFHLSVQRGALSGYHAKAFTISPPRVDLVIKKRLAFALKIATGEFPIESLPSKPTITFLSLSTLIKVLIYSIEKNSELLEFIDNISNRNIRLALDLIRGFLGSGHVDTKKIINIYESGQQYIIPLHEFLRAVIYGDTEHYDPERSPIGNLFDVTQLDHNEHFILPLILGLLISLSSAGTEEGFVETSRVYTHLQALGFLPEQIDLAIVKAYKKKLIETAARRMPLPGQPIPEALRITTDGVYHVSKICRLFVYIDAVIVDTPILDALVRGRVGSTHDINFRLERARIFCSYLDKQWQKLKNSGSAFDWNNVSVDLKANIDYIEKKNKRHQGIS
ncbi:MAG: hypothetical protein WCY09_05250 [Candidatus Omnitrophota bacterium]